MKMQTNSDNRNLNNPVIYTSTCLLCITALLFFWSYSNEVIITTLSKALSIIAGLYFIQKTHASSMSIGDNMESAYSKKA